MPKYLLLVIFMAIWHIPLYLIAQTPATGQAPSPPDLIIKDAQLSPSSARPGQKVTITLKVTNQGQITLQKDIVVRGKTQKDNWSEMKRFIGLQPKTTASIAFSYPVPLDAKKSIPFLFTVSSPEEPSQKRGNNHLQIHLRIIREETGIDMREKEPSKKWILIKISPQKADTMREKEVTFNIRLKNLTGAHHGQGEISLIPTLPVHKNLFEIKSFKFLNIAQRQEIIAKIGILPSHKILPGLYGFQTSIRVPGSPPIIIKNGPRLQIIQSKDDMLSGTIISDEILIISDLEKSALSPFINGLKRTFHLELINLTELSSLKKSLIHLRITDGSRVDDIIEALSGDAHIIATQPNYIYKSTGNESDPLSELQYASKITHVHELPPGITGGGVKIGLIDTGIDHGHQDLKGNIIDKKDIVGEGFSTHEVHGTALAGIIAARCGNGLGICGIAEDADIVGIRACRPVAEGKIPATTTSFWLAQGLDYAILQRVDAMNLSLGGPRDPLIIELIQKAFSKGIVIVAASGDKSLPTYPPYPAVLPEVIAVSAVDMRLNPYSEGIKGDFIDICGPGVDIMTTIPGNKYNFYTGTSMAAAYVTGVVALLLQKFPDKSPRQIKKILEASAKDLGPPGKDDQFGYGIVQAGQLLEKKK